MSPSAKWESSAELLCVIASECPHPYARKSSCFLRTFLLFAENATLDPQLSQQFSVREYDYSSSSSLT
jgi:hypothetical protein